MNDVLALRLKVIALALLVVLVFTSSLIALDQSSHNIIEKIIALAGSIAGTISFVVLYTNYKAHKEEYLRILELETEIERKEKALKDLGVVCAFCNSTNIIVKEDKIYCLSCGKISQMVKKVET